MALPAVVVYLLFSRLAQGQGRLAWVAGFGAGFLGILFSALMVSGALAASGEAFSSVARLVIVAHVPIMFVEGILTAVIVAFLGRVRPAMLGGASPGVSKEAGR
jgi:cobalt/nickel transport system permease protein